MKIHRTAPLLLLMLFSAAHADDEASNRPVVRASQYGIVYAKSIPEAEWGQDGITRVYFVGSDEDTLIAEYDWYAGEIYIGGQGDATVVRFGPWQRGGCSSPDHLAIGFYRNGQVIREYSTQEIENHGSGISVSVSHYEVFGRRAGFLCIEGELFVYTVMGVGGKAFAFDLNTGEILE